MMDRSIFCRKLFSLLLIILLGGVGGCASLQDLLGMKPQPPDVQLQQIEVTRISLAGISLNLQLKVLNPNRFDLKFAKLDYRLFTLNLPLAHGAFAQAITIPRETSRVVKIP